MGQKLELGRVHVLEKIPGSMQYRLTRTQTAVRLCRDKEVVWVQRGMVFDDGGVPLEKNAIPAWFADELKNVNPAVLKEAGFALKGA